MFNNDDDLIEYLEEAYAMADTESGKEEYILKRSDIESIWQNGYYNAWIKLSRFLIILSAVNIVSLIVIGTILWIK